jgi:hypothetical protein
MPVSSRPLDKFAFLLTGPATSRYIKDLKNVFDTLTGFYNFPASNIWVVQGADSFVDSGLFTGAEQHAIGLESDPLQKLKDIFHTELPKNFIKTITDHIGSDAPPAGEFCTVVLYFTGCRDGASSTLDLVIRPGIASNEISLSCADLKDLIQYPRVGPTGNPFLRECLLNVIMQQDYCGSYNSSTALNAPLLINNRCFTYACGDAETAAAGVDGSQFTEGWTRGLQWKQRLSSLDPGDADYNKFTDQLSPAGDPYMITLEQASIFAGKLNNATNYGFFQALSGETAMHLGKPVLLMQDGIPNWWQTPDIFLTHPHGSDPDKHTDLYITDADDATGTYNNTIHVLFRNTGTHPVRCYSIGTKIFRTPFGVAPDSPPTQEEYGIAPNGGVLKPVNQLNFNDFSDNTIYEEHVWNTPFYSELTHQCVWAKVQLPDAGVIDFTWKVLINENEAQRNIDMGSDPPKSLSRQSNADTFRGNKKHIYSIQNPFKEKHRFIICTTPEFQKSTEYAMMKWYFPGRNGKWERPEFETIEKGYKGIVFILNGGESINIIGEFGFKKGVKEKKVEMPVEILVDRIEGMQTRPPMAKTLGGKFAAIAGFTIILTNEHATLECNVIDGKGDPINGAMVHIQTINGLQKGEFTTNKYGKVVLNSINPDVYRVEAVFKKLKSKRQIIELTGKKTANVKLEIILPQVKPEKKK